jgi:hypothetical protein
MTPAKLIEKYLKLRNRVADIKQRHTDELKPYTEVMAKIEATLLNHLTTTSLDSIKSDEGTAYRQTVTSVTVTDWNQALRYVREREAWDLLEARVAKGAALTMIEESQQPIPGVKISQTLVLRVRTAGG